MKVFLGPNATEAELSQVSSPRVLHLATHGFFLPEVELGKQTNPLQQPSEIPKTKLENPMHRSGLALAGAQRTLEAWSRGEVPPIENDGIVTAEEVGGLKLNGTWLVVLSACETGSGEARAGEGVMGLRRGFIQAGAQNLLMTLWPISDKTTVQIMLDFYEAADKTHNAPEALAEVQRNWLVKLRKELGLRAAVRLAGPFIMSSQGKPHEAAIAIDRFQEESILKLVGGDLETEQILACLSAGGCSRARFVDRFLLANSTPNRRWRLMADEQDDCSEAFVSKQAGH